MRNDEEGTIDTWWSYRRDIIDPIIAEYSGRIVKLTGDGFPVNRWICSSGQTIRIKSSAIN